MRETHIKENVEPIRNDTNAFLEIPVELIRNGYLIKKYVISKHKQLFADLK